MSETVRVSAGASVEDIERAAEQAGVGGCIVFAPGVIETDRTIRLAEGRFYMGNGCIIRPSRQFMGGALVTLAPDAQLRDFRMELQRRRSLLERVTRWLRVHVLRQRLHDGPGTMLSGVILDNQI